jgi:precorrin-6B C5,15-methyltransferase / cobalt-precorrin-6B C5,C15-methyltransferase
VSEPWLTVVGIGEDGLEGLSPAARALVETAEVLVGGERHLAMVPEAVRVERLPWRRPLADTFPEIEARRGRRVVVLASGDPMCFGVGEALRDRFGIEALRIVPAPSAFSLVCARLGWSRLGVETLSLHGRAPHVLLRFVYPGARLIVLSHDGETPQVVAEMLAERGYGPSRMWAFERLGGNERRVEGRADSWPAERLDVLNTVAVACEPGPGVPLLPRTAGLPDDAFRSEGMITKREVRAAALARLMPFPGHHMWDVGAGSGSISIEWLRAVGRGRATAVERDPARCAVIAGNADALGTPEVEVVFGEAPACLADLDPPDAVFVGGGLSRPGLLDACWEALKPAGRLVANAVTAEGELALLEWHKRFGGDLVRLAVTRAERMGELTGWRALAPVTMLAAQKP